MNISTLKRFGKFLALSLLLVVGQAQADLDNQGKDFISSFLPNYSGGAKVEVHLTGSVATNVTVEYPVNNPTFSTTVAVVPGTVTVVSLPETASSNWIGAGAAENNSVRMFAADEFVAYLINLIPYTSDAALALPIDTMNTEYIVSTYDAAFYSSHFVVTAAFDNTTVTITPTLNLDDGKTAGTPFNVVLNRGEAYYASSSVSGVNGGLAGSIVTSDKPVGLTNGNRCTQVPVGTYACDTIFEVAQPTASWGNEVMVVNLPDRPNGTIYRIMPSQDGTAIKQDGADIGTVNRGGYLEVGPIAGNHVFSADKPIFVTQFMTGQGSPGATTGDPAMGNMVPAAQYLKSYTFATPGAGQFALHYLTVIANNADLATIALDGVAIGAGNFTAIPGTSFSGATVVLSEGTHSTSSANPHGITVEGYNGYDSYIFPGGALFKFINPQGDANPPLCSLSIRTGGAFVVDGTGTDNRPSEDTNGNKILDAGEDLNGNGQIDKDTGVFFVELLSGASNLSMSVNPFVPGSATATYVVSLTDSSQPGSGTVRVTDGAGNTCEAAINSVQDLGCTSTDISGQLVTLDGRAHAQRYLAISSANQLKKAGGSAKEAKSIITQANDLYLATWMSLYTQLGTSITSCQNTLLCTTSSKKGVIDQYLSNSSKLKSLADSAAKKLGALGQTTRSKNILKRSAALHKGNTSLAKTVPTSVSTCSIPQSPDA